MERNKTYYQQHPMGTGSGLRPPTMTVRQLIDQLAELDPELPVIIRSPHSGCFGARMGYAIDGAKRETLDEQTEHYPATTWFDEERGIDVPQEAYDETRPAWDGVVIE
jgi:hypothetical protein